MACAQPLEHHPRPQSSPCNSNEPHPQSSPSHTKLQVMVAGSDETDGSFSTPSYSSGLHPVLRSQGSNRVQSHRQRIVREIYDTEHSYISQLTTIVSMFLKPIRVGCLLPQVTITAIFSNIEAILSVNQELFASMRKRSLGEAFSHLGPFLKLYSTFAENYQQANETLQECLRQDSDFSSFVVSTESRPECCGLRLSSLLITPVQRVPRYKLLLEDLLKHTKGTHTDYNKLKAASAEVVSVTMHINEHVRRHENFMKMLSIQQSLVGPSIPSILSPARSFIYEGGLMKVCRTFKYKKASERMVFLFSDVLIYAKPTRTEKKNIERCYDCRCVLPLLHSTVRLLSEDERAPDITRLIEISNGDTSLVFYSLDPGTVTKWADKIHNTIRELQDNYSSLLSQQDAHRPTPTPSNSTSRGDEDSRAPPQLYLNTLTKDTPYPLMATLFSPLLKDHHSKQGTPTLDNTPHTLVRNNQTTTDHRITEAQSSEHLTSTNNEANSMIEAQGTGTHFLEAMVELNDSESRDTDQLIEDKRQPDVRSLSTIYSQENNYLTSRCCTVL